MITFLAVIVVAAVVAMVVRRRGGGVGRMHAMNPPAIV